MAVGSVVVGYGLARVSGIFFHRITDVPSSVIVQFVSTFGVWILAERLGLSGVVTIVVYGVTVAWRPGAQLSARLRIPSFAVWESVTVVLNVLAFTLIGLQLRPILEGLSHQERFDYVRAALVILATVIAVRIAWVMSYNTAVRLKNHWFGVHVARSSMAPPTARGGLAIAWCGMRGMVTLAAALALPERFPYRDFILLAAFTVVIGTLTVQGLTLKPLMALLRLPDDDPVRKELKLARAKAAKAVLAELEREDSPAAEALRREYDDALSQTRQGRNARDSAENALRRRAVTVSREAIADLRKRGEIGDDAYRALEEEFDWLELSARE